MEKQSPTMQAIYKEFHKKMDKPGFLPLKQAAVKNFDDPVIFTDNKYPLVSLYPSKRIEDYDYDPLDSYCKHLFQKGCVWR